MRGVAGIHFYIGGLAKPQGSAGGMGGLSAFMPQNKDQQNLSDAERDEVNNFTAAYLLPDILKTRLCSCLLVSPQL